MNDDFKTIRVLSRPETIRLVGVSERTWERLEAAGDVPPKTRLSEGRIGSAVAAALDRILMNAPPETLRPLAKQLRKRIREISANG